jgi:hypothetical protein
MKSNQFNHIRWFHYSAVALLVTSCCVFNARITRGNSDYQANGSADIGQAPAADTGVTSDRGPAATPTLRIVPGLTPQDIYMNLEASGFGKHTQTTGVGNSPDKPQVVVFRGEDDSMASAGVYMTYLVKTGGATEAETVSEAAFSCTAPTREIAARYLGFCASIPYDSSQPASAQAWVQRVVNQGTPRASKLFGPAEFTILCDSPTKGAYVLDIVPAKE